MRLPPLLVGVAAIFWLQGGPARAAEGILRTADGLELALGPGGGVDSLALDGRRLPLAQPASLFWVRDATASSPWAPVECGVESAPGGVLLRSRNRPLQLLLQATVSNRPDYIQIDGEVRSLSPGDRCVDLKVTVPLAAGRFHFDSGISDDPAPRRQRRARARGEDGEIDESLPDDNDAYPLCPVSDVADHWGLTLAVPPTHPTRFLAGLDSAGAFVLLRIGLSDAAATPGRTSFRLILYRQDPAWSFRSALAHYYDFYREPFFVRRVRRIGAWTTQNPSLLRHPELYAYHEIGFKTWRHPKGTDSGIGLGKTLDHLDEGPVGGSLADYERQSELATDHRLGIYSLPYTIVGQAQMIELPTLPADYAAAMKALADWQPASPIPFNGPPQAESFRSPEEWKAIIRNSGIEDPGGRLSYWARAYRGPTLTFPQNPNPALFRDSPRPTIANYTLDYYLPKLFQSSFVGGCYVDSLGRWCSYYNFRREHFKYSSLPLTYAGEVPRPCLWNLQSHAEYLWELGRRLHAAGKIFVANGVHPDRVLLGFASDVMGNEGTPTYDQGEGFYTLRVAAGIKPYCLLNASHRVSPKLWNSCLYQGYLMGCNAPEGLADEAKYLPVIIECNQAGWEPVTAARAFPRTIGVERWGGGKRGGPLLFTVMNRSRVKTEARLTVDLSALPLARAARFQALPASLPVSTTRTGDELTLTFVLEPEQATALRLEPGS